MESAPYLDDIADGAPAHAVWLRASDGVRLRIAQWPCDGAIGTVLIFPGRTEYIEKYSRVARDLARRGLGAAAIDWRGQGLAERLAENTLLGHVGTFLDYQRDVAEILRFLTEVKAPRPWYLLAHSMGGAIGLRALISGLEVESAVFSAPMWGIAMPAFQRPFAASLPAIARRLGRELSIVPGSSTESHIAVTPFEENLLTHDPDHYGWFQSQLAAHPELCLAGPSIRWLGEALREMRALARDPRPEVPVLTLLGTEEEIVSARAIYDIHNDWSQAELQTITGAKHEILMESPDIRDRALDLAIAHWSDGRANPSRLQASGQV